MVLARLCTCTRASCWHNRRQSADDFRAELDECDDQLPTIQERKG